jgi:hypothetical protein
LKLIMDAVSDDKNKVLKVQSRCAHVAQNGEKWDLLSKSASVHE